MRVRLRAILLFVAVLLVNPVLAQSAANTQPDKLLNNPRKTLHTFLYWQQKGHTNKNIYVLPLEKAEGSKKEKIELAEQLKKVLDARGLLVEFDKVPDDPNYTDSLSGNSTYILFNELPEVYLVKSGNRWVFAEATVTQIPDLYLNTFSSVVEAIIAQLPDWARDELFGIEYWQFIGVFLWLLLAFVLTKIFEYVIHNYIIKWTKKTTFKWDDTLLAHVRNPVEVILISFILSITYTNLQLPVEINFYIHNILRILISIGLVWLLYNLSDVFARYLTSFTASTTNQLDDQLIPLVRKTLRFFIVVMGVILILQNNGYNVASLIAGLGIGGLAVALAARETLANFFGSVTILLDKPFKVGDWVKIGSEEGTIEEVGFRSTRIRTFYNSLVSVPNSKVADTAIDNLGLRKYRRLKLMLGLTYSTTPTQMEAFVEGIKALVKSNEHIRQDYYEVHFNNFGPHSLDVLVYIFFDVPDWSTELQERHNFLLALLQLAKEVGVEFAFPTQTLHVDSFYKENPRKVGMDKSEDELGSAVLSFAPGGAMRKSEGVQLYRDGKPIDFGSSK
jgi:MscS family membrane protein